MFFSLKPSNYIIFDGVGTPFCIDFLYIPKCGIFLPLKMREKTLFILNLMIFIIIVINWSTWYLMKNKF